MFSHSHSTNGKTNEDTEIVIRTPAINYSEFVMCEILGQYSYLILPTYLQFIGPFLLMRTLNFGKKVIILLRII